MTVQLDKRSVLKLEENLDVFEDTVRRISGRIYDLDGGVSWRKIDSAIGEARETIRGALRGMEEASSPPQKPNTPNYTYVECERCNRKGTPRCRRKGKRWGLSVIPGCMELVENAPRFIKEGAE
jgi:hypothetical protein